jgi:hypothetical protein
LKTGNVAHDTDTRSTGRTRWHERRVETQDADGGQKRLNERSRHSTGSDGKHR